MSRYLLTFADGETFTGDRAACFTEAGRRLECTPNEARESGHWQGDTFLGGPDEANSFEIAPLYGVVRYAADGHAGDDGDGDMLAEGTLGECRAAMCERLGDRTTALRWDGLADDGDVEAYHESGLEGCGGWTIRSATDLPDTMTINIEFEEDIMIISIEFAGRVTANEAQVRKGCDRAATIIVRSGKSVAEAWAEHLASIEARAEASALWAQAEYAATAGMGEGAVLIAI